jgi:pimeloyl-ACP methyl ester carboxylesterase
VTTSTLTATTTPAAKPAVADQATSWDEPEGVAPRGTLIVLTGRGETASSYQRLGRRISADAYKVRVVQVDLDDLEATHTKVLALLVDETLPAPRVLVGSDTGATYAAVLAAELEGIEGLVLSGLALPGSGAADATGSQQWDDELEARTACPTHRRVLSEDADFTRGALSTPLPGEWDASVLADHAGPVLVLHGSADPVTVSSDAFEPFRDAPGARLRLVVGGRHDVLNDVSHRSVAATIVLFLESLKLGSNLPTIVGDVQG